MRRMPAIPQSTRDSITWKLLDHAGTHWPQLDTLRVNYRGGFAYVSGVLPGGEQIPLCRLRYGGSAHQWGFAIYRASHDDYQESIFPNGLPFGTCQNALDLACGLYLNDPTAWQDLRPPTN